MAVAFLANLSSDGANVATAQTILFLTARGAASGVVGLRDVDYTGEVRTELI
jgi:hypothetical protein